MFARIFSVFSHLNLFYLCLQFLSFFLYSFLFFFTDSSRLNFSTFFCLIFFPLPGFTNWVEYIPLYILDCTLYRTRVQLPPASWQQVQNIYPCISLTVHCTGHGYSSHLPPGSSYHYLEFSTCIERVVRFLGWDKFSLIGSEYYYFS